MVAVVGGGAVVTIDHAFSILQKGRRDMNSSWCKVVWSASKDAESLPPPIARNLHLTHKMRCDLKEAASDLRDGLQKCLFVWCGWC